MSATFATDPQGQGKTLRAPNGVVQDGLDKKIKELDALVGTAHSRSEALPAVANSFLALSMSCPRFWQFFPTVPKTSMAQIWHKKRELKSPFVRYTIQCLTFPWWEAPY